MRVEPVTLRDCVQGPERSWMREVGWWLTPIGILAGAGMAAACWALGSWL